MPRTRHRVPREEQHLSQADVADRWGVSLRQIESLRYRGMLPPALRIGRAVRWRVEDIEQYEADRIEGSGPPAA